MVTEKKKRREKNNDKKKKMEQKILRRNTYVCTKKHYTLWEMVDIETLEIKMKNLYTDIEPSYSIIWTIMSHYSVVFWCYTIAYEYSTTYFARTNSHTDLEGR